MGLSRRQFTQEFKLAAIRRLEQGVSIGEVALAAEAYVGTWKLTVELSMRSATPTATPSASPNASTAATSDTSTWK